MTLSRLRTAGAVLLTTTTLLLGACGSVSDTSDDDSGGTAGDAFPVTIDSALGEAVIPAAPKRVITLGQGSAETSIALGNIPVGMEEYAWGADETGYLPWVHEAVTEADGDLPELVGSGEELDMKKIIKLAPDVILAPWSGLTQEQFDALNAIAPTVAYPDQAWSVNWDEQIEIIGKALGQEDEAAGLISDLEGQLADAAEAHPEYSDYSFSYVYTTPDTLASSCPMSSAWPSYARSACRSTRRSTTWRRSRAPTRR